jgi:predicted RNA-binding protein with PUA-like domain
MKKWLIKSDPEEYGWNEMQKDKTTLWTGVRNYQARNNMRAMKKGDALLFYHSNADMAVVAICQVVGEAMPDPTATEGDWSCVEIKAVKKLKQPVPLAQIKSHKDLKEFGLVRNGRLSVMPVSEKEWEAIMTMAGEY